MQLGGPYSPPVNYPEPASPEPSYSPSYPPVPCPQKLLISCQPSLQQAPCSSNYAPESYAPSYPKPSYRFANEDEAEEQNTFVGQPQMK